MSRQTKRSTLAAVLVVALIAAGCGSASPAAPSQLGLSESSNSISKDTATSVVPNTEGSESEPSTSLSPIEFPTGIVPIRIRIPAIDVDANVIDLDIRGIPEVPDDFAEVGWYEQTRRPGELGPSVLAGHIDSQSGPAVFFRLNELEEGDRIEIWSADGDSRDFEVMSSGQYPKDDLPEEVFGYAEPVSELRLITCGGTFDRSSGHYQDNFVVYTREVGTT